MCSGLLYLMVTKVSCTCGHTFLLSLNDHICVKSGYSDSSHLEWDWIGLDWIGLDWIGLDWIGLDWIGLVGLDWIELDWIGLDWIGVLLFSYHETACGYLL